MALCLAGSLISQAKDELSNDAVRLVRVLELERAALFSAQVPFLLSQERKKGEDISDEEKLFLICLKSADTSKYVNIYADAVVKQMTPEEIQQSIYFFEGDVGKKFNQQGFVYAYKMFHLHTDEALQEFSSIESAELDAFKKTTAGNKLLTQAILSERSVESLMLEQSQEIIKGCLKKSYLLNQQR